MRNILVTGASKGIGQAICTRLVCDGHRVTGLSRTAMADGDRLTHHQVDLANCTSAATTVAELARLTPFDAIVCNAGAGRFGSLENFSVEQIEQQLMLNLASPLSIVRTLLPTLKAHSRSDIVFIGSESALQGGRYGSIYSAAKFGLRGAAQALRYECAAANCHVGIVQPGMVRSEFFDELDFEPGSASDNALHPEDVANAVASMLHAPDHAVIDEITLNPLKHVVQRKKRDG